MRWRGKRKTAAALAVVLAALAPAPAGAQWNLQVDSPPQLEAAADRVHGVDARQLAAALESAGLALPAQVRVTLVPENGPLALQTPHWFVGLATGTRDIVIFPGRVSSYPYDSLETVVRHEVVHLALTARAGGRAVPRWFHEGTAVSVESGWHATDRVRLLFSAMTEPAIGDVSRLFSSPRQPDTSQAYLLAAALMDDLRRRHGSTLPGRIAARVAAGAPFDAAFEIETGDTPEAAAARAWRGYRRWTSWAPSVASPSGTWSMILALAFVAFFVRLWKRARRRREEDGESGN